MYNMNDLILYGSIVLLGRLFHFFAGRYLILLILFRMKIVIILINLLYLFILWTPIKVVSFYIELFLSQKYKIN